MEFLAVGTRTGKPATASENGAPHVAPLWFAVDGGDAVFTTGHDRVKGRRLRVDPRAAPSVDVQEFPYSFATVRGPVRIEQAPGGLLHRTIRFAGRCVPPGRAEEYGRRDPGPTALVCRLRMEHITGFADIAFRTALHGTAGPVTRPATPVVGLMSSPCRTSGVHPKQAPS
ncbi:hypothetical protein HDA32_003038 [Spinactinospora alkalitolerans]|uniref:Pyridoxamine 5'-phosphate oxidase N-terminal domain-containing protein n=1 Tax=Spinactinospora alkalitolerans TaxID=687207 RepID=A0A852TVF1_9ACTN|nr:PPOX class F420-dependent oxidoreductase [Spinactinospora alkalitolerans]NYE47918.1 hypothetical protein [Spinactinospora alkalitolerans]